MAEKGYTLGEEAATRVSEVVRRVETGPRDEGLIRRRRPGAHDQPALQWIECTNNVPDGTGRYAAIWVQYDEQDDTWTDREECYLRPGANGETPVAGQRYLARCQGPHPTTNKPVYVPASAGGASGSFSGFAIYPKPAQPRSQLVQGEWLYLQPQPVGDGIDFDTGGFTSLTGGQNGRFPEIGRYDLSATVDVILLQPGELPENRTFRGYAFLMLGGSIPPAPNQPFWRLDSAGGGGRGRSSALVAPLGLVGVPEPSLATIITINLQAIANVANTSLEYSIWVTAEAFDAYTGYGIRPVSFVFGVSASWYAYRIGGL